MLQGDRSPCRGLCVGERASKVHSRIALRIVVVAATVVTMQHLPSLLPWRKRELRGALTCVSSIIGSVRCNRRDPCPCFLVADAVPAACQMTPHDRGAPSPSSWSRFRILLHGNVRPQKEKSAAVWHTVVRAVPIGSVRHAYVQEEASVHHPPAFPRIGISVFSEISIGCQGCQSGCTVTCNTQPASFLITAAAGPVVAPSLQTR